MNLKKIIDLGRALRDHDEMKSDPRANVGTGVALFSIEKDFKEVLRSFEIHPADVTTSPLVEVYPTKFCTTPNLYLNQTTAEDRTNEAVGRSRLLRVPPIQATAEFTLLGAAVRFRTYDLFVEFEPKLGDYILCISASKGMDNDYVNKPAPEGLLTRIQNGSWR